MTSKLYLATPSQDHQVAAAYAFSVLNLALTTRQEIEIPPVRSAYDCDIVRVRNRYVREFLASDCTHLLFVDADVSFAPRVIEGLLASKRDIVGAPYPRKRLQWQDLAAPPDGRHPEARAYTYPVQFLPSEAVDPETSTVRVRGMGIGCCLISRPCLTRMTAYYREAEPELLYDDPVADGTSAETVNLFGLVVHERGLLSEDYSFFHRARAIREDVHLYLGPGSPVSHHGSHDYRGHLEAFTGPRG